MRIPRLYCPDHLQPGTEAVLPETAHRHVIQVLRLRAGDRVIVFNGDGNDCPGVLTRADKRSTRVQIESCHAVDNESGLHIHLVQGISRRERMDLTIRKGVELGVSCITPLVTERSVVNLAGERLQRRQQHWLSIVTSACEQCGRSRLPVMNAPATLANWLTQADDGARLILAPAQTTRIRQLPVPTTQRVTLMVGPEGGFTLDEYALAEAAGYTGINLGPRILRTETAAIASIAMLQAQWGDMG
jgi:16S rRNA (uracil1498-N3)-methyltransferase